MVRQRTTFTVSLHHLEGFVISVKLIEKIGIFWPKIGLGKDFLKEFLTNPFFGKKIPIFCDFLYEFNSNGKTFQVAQRDCECGPLTHHIMLLKFEDFLKNQFFDEFFWKK